MSVFTECKPLKKESYRQAANTLFQGVWNSAYQTKKNSHKWIIMLCKRYVTKALIFNLINTYKR